MLVLSRTLGEEVVIFVPPSSGPQEIRVMLVEIRGNKIRLGFTADKSVVIHRKEIHDAIARKS